VIVVDASALVDLLLAGPKAREVARHLAAHLGDLRAPHLVDVELVHALRRLVGRGEITPERAERALARLERLVIHRYPHPPLVRRAWALRANVSAYDAMHVALAEALGEDGIPLLTADRRLAAAVRDRTGVAVLLV